MDNTVFKLPSGGAVFARPALSPRNGGTGLKTGVSALMSPREQLAKPMATPLILPSPRGREAPTYPTAEKVKLRPGESMPTAAEGYRRRAVWTKADGSRSPRRVRQA